MCSKANGNHENQQQRKYIQRKNQQQKMSKRTQERTKKGTVMPSC